MPPSYHQSPGDPHDSYVPSPRLTALTLTLSLVPSFAAGTPCPASEAAPKMEARFLDECACVCVYVCVRVSVWPPTQTDHRLQADMAPTTTIFGPVCPSQTQQQQKSAESQEAGPTYVWSLESQ